MNELSLHILDICQNSIKADASLIKILINEQLDTNEYHIKVVDDGHGMSEKTLSQVADPFYTTRTTRRIGLGVSLFKMAAELANGTFDIQSKEQVGTTVHAVFQHDHVNRAPLGKIADTIMILLLNEEGIDIYYSHTIQNRTYVFDSREVKQVLNGVPLQENDVIQWIKQNIKEGIQNIQEEESQ